MQRRINNDKQGGKNTERRAPVIPQNIKKLTKREIRAEKARRSFPEFVRFVNPKFSLTPFHAGYYEILERFVAGKIKKLIITIPPQHGKSQASTILMPAYLLGIKPETRVVIASYNQSLASRFNRQIQRLIDSKNYSTVFPETKLKSPGSKENYIRTAEEFEVIGHSGGVSAVGREGALTGNPVDIMIIDDLYKDAMEANSSIIRDNAWEWYLSVVKTRLHNNSQEIIVMTRWHEDDLIGKIEEKEKVIRIEGWEEIRIEKENPVWLRLNFEALKTGSVTSIDRRNSGEALWPERQEKNLLLQKRALNPMMFECMYQGNPASGEGLLYGNQFELYKQLPADTLRKGNYTDTADTGEDYLCSVCYEVAKDGRMYITDLVYTQLGMEHTEEAVAGMLTRNKSRVAYIESNNGGRGFARNVAKLCKVTKIEWFAQTGNKESRILTNQPTVLKHIVMPTDWAVRWPEFYRHVTGYRRVFRSNRFHDAADVLTGIVEYEVINRTDKTLKKIRFSSY